MWLGVDARTDQATFRPAYGEMPIGWCFDHENIAPDGEFCETFTVGLGKD